MKVTDDRPKIPDLAQSPPGVARRSSADAPSPFRDALQTSARAQSEDRLQAMLQKVNDQGELLASRMDVSELKKYRQMVADFLNEAMNSTYASDRDSLFDARGRFKEYSVVRKVNTELEKLTSTVLSDQKDNLDILAQLGVIRGLLVDMLI